MALNKRATRPLTSYVLKPAILEILDTAASPVTLTSVNHAKEDQRKLLQEQYKRNLVPTQRGRIISRYSKKVVGMF